MSDNPRIFLSYSWRNKEKANDFKGVGITLTRDIRDTQYKTDLKEYMRSVRDHDYMLILISDYFLRSVNCMFEVMEIFKEKEFNKRVLQIILDDANIYTAKGRLSYIHYWEKEQCDLNCLIKSGDLKNLGSIFKDLKQLDNICSNIGEFLEFLANELTIPFTDLKNQNYKFILGFIGYSNSSKKEELMQIISIKDEEKQDIALEEYLEVNRELSDGYFVQGFVNQNRNSHLKAIRSYNRAIELNPENALAYYNRANGFSIKGRLGKALDDYTKAIELNPEDSVVYNNRGTFFYNEGELEKALEDYTKAIKLNPEYASAYFNRCKAFQEKGELENAERDKKKYEELTL